MVGVVGGWRMGVCGGTLALKKADKRTLARSVPARKRDFTQKMISGTRRIRPLAVPRKAPMSCTQAGGQMVDSSG